MKALTVLLAALLYVLTGCSPSEPCEEVLSPSGNTSEMSIE